MTSQYQQKIVTVDSSYKIQGSPNNYSIQVDLNQPNQFNRCSLLSGQLINTWNDVDDPFLDFIFEEGPNQITLQFTKGVYDTESLSIMVAAKLTAQSAAGGAWVIGATYTGGAANIDGRNVITIKSSTNVYFSITVAPTIYGNGTINPMVNYLGMSRDGTSVPTVVIGFYHLIFPRSSYIQRYGELQIRMREARNSNDEVLYTILPSVSSGDSIYIENRAPLQNSVYFNNSGQNQLQFTVTDVKGTLVDMDQDMQLIISFWENKI